MFTLKVISTEIEKLEILKDFHCSKVAGHQGIKATIQKIKDGGFTWAQLAKDVTNFVNKCEICQKAKLYSKTKLPMMITDTPNRPFEKVAVDLVEKLPTTPRGFKHILTVQDNFSKFVFAIPLKTKEADEVAQRFAENVILRF